MEMKCTKCERIDRIREIFASADLWDNDRAKVEELVVDLLGFSNVLYDVAAVLMEKGLFDFDDLEIEGLSNDLMDKDAPIAVECPECGEIKGVQELESLGHYQCTWCGNLFNQEVAL